jgi:MFS family permease
MQPEIKPDIERDLKRILWIQALRAFGYGFGVVVLGTALAQSGFTNFQVGLVFTSMLAGMAIASIVVGFVGDKVGRRRLYAGFLALMGLVGVVFAFSGNPLVLAAFALTGTMSTDANESGPITSLEQAMIGQAPSKARVHVFGRYNAVAYLAGALGALAAGGPQFIRRVVHSVPADQRWLLVIPLVAVPCVVLALRLSPSMETIGGGGSRRPLERSRGNVRKLSALFATDAFAGGFIVSSFIVYWFTREFHASLELMSLVFFLGGLLQAASSILAARAGARFGLLNTMVLSHFPSSLLLIAVPFMPSLGPAIAVLLVRFALSQMDVPTRQAYLAAMVDPEERTAAAAFTNTARHVVRPFGQLMGALLMASVAVGAPFVVAGAIKCGYDVLLWRTFRRVPLPD